MTTRTQLFDPIAIALEEDVGAGDITSEFFVPTNARAIAKIVAREHAVVAGTKTAAEVFRRVDPKLRVRIVRRDGSTVSSGRSIMELRGRAHSILKGERVALNFLQRLSGIATLTSEFVNAIGKQRAQILDTRKTTPGLRALEKAAVLAGGGRNHRFGLFDMALVKDNHLVARDGLSQVAASIRRLRKLHPKIKIEVEADTLDQVRALLHNDVDVILLDNMTPAQIRKAIALRRCSHGPVGRSIKFEASGGVTLKNIRQIAATGVDYISVGALTHSARAINFSLEFVGRGAGTI